MIAAGLFLGLIFAAEAASASDQRLFHSAAKNGRTEEARAYLRNGADINGRYVGRTALHEAAAGGWPETVSFLVNSGADISARTRSLLYPDRVGKTALHLSVLGARPEAVPVLLENGADLSARTNAGWTALHLAASTRAGPCLYIVSIISALLEYGADINALTSGAETALDIARSRGHIVVQTLLKEAAELSKSEIVGFYEDLKLAALDIARSSGHIMVQTLLEEAAEPPKSEIVGFYEDLKLTARSFLEDISPSWRYSALCSRHRGLFPCSSDDLCQRRPYKSASGSFPFFNARYTIIDYLHPPPFDW